MSNKKSSKRIVISRRHLLRNISLSIILAIAVYATGNSIYQGHLDRVDSERFITLKKDFLALQVEFNKVDPGWIYNDGCTAGGGVFDRESDLSCSLSLTNPNISTSKTIDSSTNKYSALAIASGYFSHIKKDSSFTNEGKSYSNRILDRKNLTLGICELSSSAHGLSIITGLSCRNDARKLHFNRTDI